MIDTRRLATDAAYWDERGAPEDATHFDIETYFFCNSEGYFYGPSGFTNWSITGVIGKTPDRFIPRPQSEWVDGLPPIGWHGECTWGAKVDWCECVILPSRMVAVNTSVRGDGWLIQGVRDYEFRDLRTKAQRDRDELAKLIDEHQELSGSFVTPENTADAIIAAGWTKP